MSFKPVFVPSFQLSSLFVEHVFIQMQFKLFLWEKNAKLLATEVVLNNLIINRLTTEINDNFLTF